MLNWYQYELSFFTCVGDNLFFLCFFFVPLHLFNVWGRRKRTFPLPVVQPKNMRRRAEATKACHNMRRCYMGILSTRTAKQEVKLLVLHADHLSTTWRERSSRDTASKSSRAGNTNTGQNNSLGTLSSIAYANESQSQREIGAHHEQRIVLAHAMEHELRLWVLRQIPQLARMK